MMKTENKIISAIKKYNMISQGDTVIIGVSGGADSMCLLNFFNEYSREMLLNLIAAHVNHGIRGDEARRDEKFVKSFCEKNGIELRTAHYDVPRIAAENHESEELCGRRLRYEFFNSIAKNSENSENAKIATAHNLNDCMETFIFNVARGSGLKGLSGIPAVRGNIIRPLIDCSRDEIEDYLKIHGVDFVTDSTNLSDDYSRNKIRHNIIPVMFGINPSFGNVFTNMQSVLRDSEDFIDSQVIEAMKKSYNQKDNSFDAQFVLSLHRALRDRVIYKICEHFGGKETEYRHVSLLCDCLQKGGGVELPGGSIVVSDGKRIFSSDVSEDKDTDIVYEEKFCEDVHYIFGENDLVVKHIDKNTINIYNIKIKTFCNGKTLTSYIDGDKLLGATVRNRREGDRFRFPGSEHSKSLKNLFSDRGIPPLERSKKLIIEKEGQLLWVQGAGTSYYAAVTDKTENVCEITVSTK